VRALGAVDLGRTADEGDFSENEIDFLHRTHVMLDGTDVTALRSAA
jgi:hypothetical protein